MTARNPVVCLQPCTRPATHVARADLLGDDAFEVDLARATKDGGPVFGDRLAWWTGACRGSTFRAGEVRHIALPP
jgi:hypothetical protein